MNIFKTIAIKNRLKQEYKEVLELCLDNIKNHIDDSILNDFDTNHIRTIDIHVRIEPDSVACYNVKKEYTASLEEK